MTIASTSAFELTVAQLITRSMQVAGLLEAGQEPREEDAAMGRDLLNMELLELQGEGYVTKTIEPETQALVASTAEYTLDTDTLDVYVGPDNVAGTVYVSAATGESRVFAMTRHEYTSLTDKVSEGHPSRVFVEKLTTVTLKFWPVPDETLTFRFQKIRLGRDTSDGATTADADKRRQKALIWTLAYDFAVAKKMGLDRVRMLEGERNRLRSVAKADDVEKGHVQLFVI